MSTSARTLMQIARWRVQRGMTLIELVIAIVIISIGLVGVLQVFTTTVKNSADPMVTKQMLAIAEGMIEEIALQPYAISANAAAVGCARNTYNDIWNYNGYATSGYICDVDGNQISALAGYSVSVAVVADNASFASVGVLTNAAAKITVTVSRSTNSLSVTSWRTQYAP